VTLLRQEGWTRWPTEVPSNPYHSVILCTEIQETVFLMKNMHICKSWGWVQRAQKSFHDVCLPLSEEELSFGRNYLSLCSGSTVGSSLEQRIRDFWVFHYLQALPSKHFSLRKLFCLHRNLLKRRFTSQKKRSECMANYHSFGQVSSTWITLFCWITADVSSIYGRRL